MLCGSGRIFGLLLPVILAVGLPFSVIGEEGGSGDITFFAVADPQINIPKWGTAGTEKTIEVMNELPGKEFPFGGVVSEPLGVLVPGDLVDSLGNRENWELYKKFFHPHGEAKLRFRVYEGIGNHDLSENEFGQFNYLQKEFIERNKSRDYHEFFYDKYNYHYSWDWGQLHMVNLNVFPGNEHRPVYGNERPWNEPLKSLDFLKATLEANVGDSGRPVILWWHYGLRGWGFEQWWTQEDLDNLKEAIADYNVVMIIHGHEHRYDHYEWEGYPVFMAPAPQYDRNPETPDVDSKPKGFLVVRLQGKELQLAHYEVSEGWKQQWSKEIELGEKRE